MAWERLSEKQMEALVTLTRHRSLPLTNGKTTEEAINQTTAWSLHEVNLAQTYWEAGERVQIAPAARQLLEREVEAR